VERSPDLVRARLLARARWAVAESSLPPEPASKPAVLRGSLWRQAALAGVMTLASAAAGARASFYVLASRAEGDQPPLAKPAPSCAPAPAPALPPATSRAERRHRTGPSLPVRDSDTYPSEVGLLRPALSEYGRGDFLGALLLIAEHSRRFPEGRLSEEAGALRVRSLAGLGRASEAREALAAFAAQFPHSAVLPRLRQLLDRP
jgi:hypothetical protein